MPGLEEAVATELRATIARHGLTQAEAARLVGTSAKHLNQVLSGRAHPSLAMLARWSDRLGIVWHVEAVDKK